MRVLLIAMPNVVFGFDRMARFPNLGLISIAGNLDCDVKVADLVLVKKGIREYVQNLLKDYHPDLVGLSCMSFQYATAVKLAKFIKEFDESIRVALGGYHPTLAYDEIARSPDAEFIDFIVRGEGEGTFNELVRALEDRLGLDEMSGLSYRKDGSFKHNEVRNLLDLDTIRLPNRSARIFNRGFHYFGLPTDVVETSRGCTYKCNFCCINHMYGRSFRRYKISRVLQDIRDARSCGAKSIFIVDDNITLDTDRFEEICDQITGSGLNDTHFFVQASVRGISSSRRLVEKMARAGFKLVFLGIENVSQSNLRFLSKDEGTAERTEKAVAYLREHGIIAIGGFILGNPEDTEETLWENYHFARRLKLDSSFFFVSTPHARTALREKLMEEGLITNKDDYSWYNGSKANVRTKYLSTDDIDRIIAKMYASYTDWEYIGFTNIWRHYPKYFLKLALSALPRYLSDRITSLLHIKSEWGLLEDARRRDARRRRQWLLEH